MKVPDFYNLIAHERGMPAEWQWYSLIVKPEPPWPGNERPAREHCFVLVRGAVCAVFYQRGPRAGHKNWTKRDKATDVEIVIGRVEYDERTMRWERETGMCKDCGGDGQELWSVGREGTKTKPCQRCGASGRAPAQEARAV